MVRHKANHKHEPTPPPGGRETKTKGKYVNTRSQKNGDGREPVERLCLPPERAARRFIGAMLQFCPNLEIAALHNPQTQAERMEKLGSVMAGDGDAAVAALLRLARGANTRGNANILARPDPAAPHPWIFIDDLPLSLGVALAEEIAALVIETSAGNCQVRLLSSIRLDLECRQAAQEIICIRFGADPGSIAGDKWGRLPGFTQRKPGKAGQWTNLRVDSTQDREPVGVEHIIELAAGQKMNETVQAQASFSPPRGGVGSLLLPGPRGPLLRGGAREGGEGGYRNEFAFACHSLRAGVQPAAVASKVAANALSRGKRRTPEAARLYAEKLVSAAQSRLRDAPHA